MTVIIQQDSVDPSTILPNPEAVAGYVGGSFPDYSELVARFPRARHKSIAVNAEEDGDILDIEKGDAIPSQAPAWFHRQKARGLALPGLYADASDMPTVRQEMDNAGIARSEYVLWVARLQAQPSPPFEQGANAIQFTFNYGGRNLDASVCEESFWSVQPSPPVKNPVHYDWFENTDFDLHGEKLNERDTVEHYDKLRAIENPTATEKMDLAVAKVHLMWLAERVHYVARHPLNKQNKPTWGLFHRGWRFQQLIHRAHNTRFV